MRMLLLLPMLTAILQAQSRMVPADWPAPQSRIAIDGVTVIDPRTRSVLPNRTVLITDVRSTNVNASGVGADYRVASGRGKFLIPGLWDNHVHLTKAGETSLALFVANGVTSVRDMGSDPAEVLRWRAEIRSGKRPG